MKLIGINWEQNSTAALIVDGTIKGCISEERFSGVKNDERYPKKAIDYLLTEYNLTPEEIDKVVFVSNKWSPTYIVTRHYTGFTQKDYKREQDIYWYNKLYKGVQESYLSIFEDKIDLNQYPGIKFWEDVVGKMDERDQHSSNNDLTDFGKSIRTSVVKQHLNISSSQVSFIDHSTSHEAYGYWTIPEHIRSNKKILSITLDAYGDDVNYSASIRINGKPKKILAKGNTFIIGRMYRYITLLLGFKPNEHEYKVMGMAPYCKSEYFQDLVEQYKKIQDVEGVDFLYKQEIKDHFFFFKQLLDGERFDTICASLQAYTEYLITKWIANLLEIDDVDAICLSGGVAMNVKANMMIAKITNKDIFVPPSPDDSSQAIGSALSYYESVNYHNINHFTGAYLGRDANMIDKDNILKEIAHQADDSDIFKVLSYDVNTACDILIKDGILGRFRGHEEFGARALGNRSIIANPQHLQIKKKINRTIKNRDFWMPFACSINEEHAKDYLQLDSSLESYRYMTLCCETTSQGSKYLVAGIHPYDQTCRPQLVSKTNNNEYHMLIDEFGKRTNIYALLNTSLNKHGKPIAGSLEDCIDILCTTNIDAFIINEWIVINTENVNMS